MLRSKRGRKPRHSFWYVGTEPDLPANTQLVTSVHVERGKTMIVNGGPYAVEKPSTTILAKWPPWKQTIMIHPADVEALPQRQVRRYHSNRLKINAKVQSV